MVEEGAEERNAGRGLESGVLRTVTGLLIALVILAGLVSFQKYLAAMATTSLWTDELWSVLHYSGKGPWTVVTLYDAPNNHIFFNLLNSVTPGRGSVEPLRARIWSFAAVTTLLAGFLAYFARRRALAWGAVPFLLFAAGPEFLDLTLQARGYGLLSLAALAASVSTVDYIRSERPRTLAFLGVTSILGAWTVPTFVFFVAPLWAVLLLAVRRRQVLLGAALSGAGILLVHLPVASQLLHQVSHFEERWGRQYSSLGAVRETIVLYLLPPVVVGRTLGNPALLALGAGLLLLVGLAWRRNRVEAKGISVLLGSVAAFFAICLVLQTPFIRSTAFIAVPIAFAVTLAASAAEFPGGIRLRRVGALAAVTFLLVRGVSAARSFTFTPLEHWKEMATILKETFPEGTTFFVTKEPQYLNAYLEAGNRIVTRPDRLSLERGEELFLDTPIVDPPEGRTDVRTIAPCAIEYRLPQRRVGYEALWFCPPTSSLVSRVRSAAGGPDLTGVLSDRDLTTGTGTLTGMNGDVWKLNLDLSPGRRYRSLVIVAKDEKTEDLAVRAWTTGSVPVPVGRIRRSGRVTLVSLGDQEISHVTIGPATSLGPPLAIQEVWANPTKPGS
jgi:hypothetical protein